MIPIATTARRFWLQLSVLLAIGLVLAAAAWSTAIERRAALEDFSHEQASLAKAVSIDFEHRLDLHNAQHGGTATPAVALVDETVLELLRGAHRLERDRELMVLVARPGHEGFLTTDHRLIPSAHLREAFDRGDETLQIARDEAVTFGLQRRLAMAGLARVEDERGQTWGVVVLATAHRVRNRERLEWWRLGLTVLVVTGLVAAFAALAQRRQRRELELERQVAVSSLEREREALLTKADKMAALAALGTGIAHEVGTPLGVIVGRVDQVLARTSTDDRSTAALRIVLEQVSRIQAIVRGCLALARGDVPHLVKTSPSSVADHAVDLVRHRFHQAEVEFDATVEPDLPDVACEPALFEQALVNVLLNGCQATPKGGCVTLTVRRDESHVLFVVDDEGLGISDDVAQRAAEPFFSTKRDEGGSGLGLTIAREIVSHHQGTLSLRRREGGLGTRATIALAI